MDFADASLIAREFLVTALILVSPVVAVSLIVGLTISLAQTVTSIQEQTLAFAPRIVAVVVVMMFLMNWYLHTLQQYTTNLMDDMLGFVKV